MRARNLVILGLGQALGVSGVSMLLFLGGIVGASLAPDPAFSTLPIGLMVIGLAATTVPAALLMKRIGRRLGFALAATVASAAAAVAALAVSRESFPLFCVAAAFVGANRAFVQQYRFAAAESVEPAQAGRAVSLVLIGGVVAGFLGPELGSRGRDWIAGAPFAGSLLVLSGLYLLVAAAMLLLREPEAPRERAAGPARPLGVIAGQPAFRVAVLAGVVSYGVMSFLMTAAPVSMHRIDLIGLEPTARVIQSHVVGMYLPSLFTGVLIGRWGPLPVAVAGVAALAGSAALGLSGQALGFYWTAMVLLGVGWNFLFVGGTTLLTGSYRPAERFKAQAANDFLVFGVQAVASLSAGAGLFHFGWKTLNLASLPFLVLMLTALLAYRRLAPARKAAPGSPAGS